MNAVVFEHVPVDALPAEWRERLDQAPGTTVTVRIEAEEPGGVAAEDPLFGMWQDRNDMTDVAGYVRNLRADRFSPGGSGKE